jgi:hypothetical protein
VCARSLVLREAEFEVLHTSGECTPSVSHGDMVPAYGGDETGNFNKCLARPTRSKKTWVCDAKSGLSKGGFYTSGEP